MGAAALSPQNMFRTAIPFWGNDRPEVLNTTPPRWTERAACLTDGGMQAHELAYRFQGREGEGVQGQRLVAHAKTFCTPCSVRDTCLAAAMAEEDGNAISSRYGIRGGLSPQERLDLAVNGESE